MKPLTEDPIFNTQTGALKFAFNFAHGGVKTWTIGSLAGGNKAGRGLAGLDGAGQAGLIRSALGRLAPIRLHILTARYVIPSTSCACGEPCCRGYRENPEWTEAIKEIGEFVLKQGATGTVSHYRLRRALVMRYFGSKESYATIAAQCGINRDTASDYQNKVTTLLKAEEKLARYEAEAVLKDAGVVDS
jgi:hypothetical protein